MANAKRYYIAYGSNLNTEQMKMCCPDAQLIGTSAIEGCELLFKGSGTGAYLTIEPSEDGSVPAAVWEVTAADERRLDRYEGYPVFYHKTKMKLRVTLIGTDEVKTLEGFAYVMCSEKTLGMPAIDYFITCAHGYQTFGFETRILMDAYDKSKEGILCAAKQQ